MIDPLLSEAKQVSIEQGFVTVSSLQRKMRVGYVRAARLIDFMVEEGFCEKEGDDTGKRLLLPAAHHQPEGCICYDAIHPGDNPDCPVHGQGTVREEC